MSDIKTLKIKSISYSPLHITAVWHVSPFKENGNDEEEEDKRCSLFKVQKNKTFPVRARKENDAVWT